LGEKEREGNGEGRGRERKGKKGEGKDPSDLLTPEKCSSYATGRQGLLGDPLASGYKVIILLKFN